MINFLNLLFLGIKFAYTFYFKPVMKLLLGILSEGAYYHMILYNNLYVSLRLYFYVCGRLILTAGMKLLWCYV